MRLSVRSGLYRVSLFTDSGAAATAAAASAREAAADQQRWLSSDESATVCAAVPLLAPAAGRHSAAR